MIKNEIFYSIKLFKKNGEFDKYILVSYIIIFKNSLIFFYLLRLILLLFGAFIFYFFNILNLYILNEVIEYFLVIAPIIFLMYLIIKKNISNKGIKLILLVCYEILLICFSPEITIAIGYQ